MKKESADNIKEMFNRISTRYIIMNKLMTFGRDSYWRKELIRLVSLKDGDKLLDVATGTGDVIKEAIGSKVKLDKCTGVDFSIGMLEVAKLRFSSLSGKHAYKLISVHKVEWIEGDAFHLPFKGSDFDVVTSAYLMGNVGDVAAAFTEQYRVLKPGGRAACLDTTPPIKTIMSPFINFYLLKIIPLLGAFISGHKSAYTYLPETTKSFKTADELKEIMTETGFEKNSYKKYMFGTIVIHWGEKPLDKSVGSTIRKAIETTDE